ncbi:MAG: YbgC/FadM family acyl-CoA thioesterase [Rhodobiaceae bacterium]|jgi:acyl-CoA thioester hydrolase|nr:YbgC/FadM family acyl-CoA thioesterase [Rhodobiaceae bacterium]
MTELRTREAALAQLGSQAALQGVFCKTEIGIRHMMQVVMQYEDTDFSGFVYHANYIKFAERGRSNFLRLAGVEHSALLQMQPPLAFVVGRMEMDFLAPARIDDCLLVETVFTQFRGARLLAEHAISRQTASGDSEPIWQAHVLAACVDLQGRAKRMPKTMLADLTPYQGTAILAPPK